MSRWRASLLAVAAFATLASSVGCGSLRPITSDPADYADYRVFAFHRREAARIPAAWAYLKTHPAGQYRAEVARWFADAEGRLSRSKARASRGRAPVPRALARRSARGR